VKSNLGRLGTESHTLFDIFLDSIGWANERMAFHSHDD
jgi:hypothetical protein